jgi:hypothetical protein
VVRFTLRSLYTRGKSRWHPMYMRLGGSQGRSERCGEENNLAPAKNGIPAVAIPTEVPDFFLNADVTGKCRCDVQQM